LAALEATGDIESAVSALIKGKEHSSNPEAHENENMECHPKVSKRIAALRNASAAFTNCTGRGKIREMP